MADYLSFNPLLPGQKKAGNIDVSNLPSVWNPETQGWSTVFSEGIGTGEGEVLIPRIKNGKYLGPEEAESEYRRTKEHLGIFDTVDAASKYGEMLHRQQELSPMIKSLFAGLLGR